MVPPLASSFKCIVRLGLDPFQVEVNPVIFCKQNTSLHFIIKGEKDEALINPHKPTLCQTAFLFTKIHTTWAIISGLASKCIIVFDQTQSNCDYLSINLLFLHRNFILNKENGIFVKNLKVCFLSPYDILREYTPYKTRYQQNINSLGKFLFF